MNSKAPSYSEAVEEAEVFKLGIMRLIVESEIDLPVALLALIMVQNHIKEAIKNPMKAANDEATAWT